ncbi:MAG: hypothetical protein WAL50_06835 [Kineosporiaceae bacterium]|jgi:hypothetical protein
MLVLKLVHGLTAGHQVGDLLAGALARAEVVGPGASPGLICAVLSV